MYYVSEDAVRACVNQDMITKAVEQAFLNLADQQAENFPVVRQKLNYADAIFGFKSGFDRGAGVLGVKAGGLWPGNFAKGIANHQSTIILFDKETGGPQALVRGTYLTALRTAAASALSIRFLARKNASTLGCIGAGGQSLFQIRAALKERPFSEVLIFDSDIDRANSVVATLTEENIKASVIDVEALCLRSDVIITVTPSFEPIVKNAWVKPGVHFACMGADTKGKQELEAQILRQSLVYCDAREQAVSLGESQHAYNEGLLALEDLTTLGLVMLRRDAGRQNDNDITVFDSTGMGLQDLAAAEAALGSALDNSLAVSLD